MNLLVVPLIVALSGQVNEPLEGWRPRHFRGCPSELQFSCAISVDSYELKLASALSGKDPADQLSAARELWQGHSRRHATDVLKYLAGSPPGGRPFRAFQQEVEAALKPEAILRELSQGDFNWGCWLAFLRPHKDVTTALLADLKGPQTSLPETILALGNSGDDRALEPLLELLASRDYQTPGDAARALGYLGDPKAETKLIEALSAESGWARVNACAALAKIGTSAAKPALERLAKDPAYTGALAIRPSAERAIKAIETREARAKKAADEERAAKERAEQE